MNNKMGGAWWLFIAQACGGVGRQIDATLRPRSSSTLSCRASCVHPTSRPNQFVVVVRCSLSFFALWRLRPVAELLLKYFQEAQQSTGRTQAGLGRQNETEHCSTFESHQYDTPQVVPAAWWRLMLVRVGSRGGGLQD